MKMMMTFHNSSYLLSLWMATTTSILIQTIGSNAWIASSSSSSPLTSSLSTSNNNHHHNYIHPWSRGGQQYQSSPSSSSLVVVASSSSSSDDNDVPPYCEIIGAGRIGETLAKVGNCRLLSQRSDTIDPTKEGSPIFIATRNDSLNDIIDNCPTNRLQDLVFLQNGYLDDFLSSKGLLDNTQVLLYLSVSAKGIEPVDGITSYNPEGLTAVMGKHSTAFAQRLNALQLKCNVISSDLYRPAMFEKLIWISTYMLVGTAKGCSSVGEAGSQYKELIQQVISELMNGITTKEEGIKFPPGTIERLQAYTDVVADFPCAVKEFEWRNQYFYQLGNDIVPLHNSLLQECKEKGLLSFELP